MSRYTTPEATAGRKGKTKTGEPRWKTLERSQISYHFASAVDLQSDN